MSKHFHFDVVHACTMMSPNATLVPEMVIAKPGTVLTKKIHRMLWFAPVFLVSLEKTGDINLVHSFEVFFKQYGILYANLDYYRNVLGSGTDDLPGKAISSVSH